MITISLTTLLFAIGYTIMGVFTAGINWFSAVAMGEDFPVWHMLLFFIFWPIVILIATAVIVWMFLDYR